MHAIVKPFFSFEQLEANLMPFRLNADYHAISKI